MEFHLVGQSKLNFLVKDYLNCLAISSKFSIYLGIVVQYATLSQIFSSPCFTTVNPSLC